jgi:hypothetical protein
MESQNGKKSINNLTKSLRLKFKSHQYFHLVKKKVQIGLYNLKFIVIFQNSIIFK